MLAVGGARLYLKGAAVKASRNRTGSVRIIAGEWRGRRLPVVDLPGLRPSGDRSRETLFNWLQGELRGARCVDLFAGTGVLGLEALSRGASTAVLVEKDSKAAEQLRANVSLLRASQARVLQEDALAWLRKQPAGSIDIAFVDPPFGHGLAEEALQLLQGGGAVRPGGLVYLESARTEVIATPAGGWETVRDKTLGEVRMQLLRRLPGLEPAPAKPPSGC